MILFSTSLYLCHSSWRFSLYCVSYLLTEWNDFTYYARNQNAPPCLTIFKNYSSFQKHKNIVRPQSHIAQVQADRLRYIYIYIYIYIPWFYLVLPITSHHSRRSQKRKKQSKLSKQLVRKKISLKVKNNLESWVQACLSRLPLVYGAVKHFGIVWICVTSQSADFSCMRLPRTPLCLFA